MEKKVKRMYKGFSSHFSCRGFRYKVGETYEEDGTPLVCVSGFHACPNPLDVLTHYGDIIKDRFGIVELLGSTDESSDHSKMCSNKIKIVEEISYKELLRKGIAYQKSMCDKLKKPDVSKAEIIDNQFRSCMDKMITPDVYRHLESKDDDAAIIMKHSALMLSTYGLKANIRVLTGKALSVYGEQSIVDAGAFCENLNILASNCVVSSKSDQSYTNINGYQNRVMLDAKNVGVFVGGASNKIVVKGDYNSIISRGMRNYISVASRASEIISTGVRTNMSIEVKDVKVMSTGDSSHAVVDGASATIASMGECAKVSTLQSYATIFSSGGDSQIFAGGNCSEVMVTGYNSSIVSEGNDTKIYCSGNYCSIISSGENCIITTLGYKCCVKAKVGTMLNMLNYDSLSRTPNRVLTAMVDGENIKEDCLYVAIDGEFKQVDEPYL